MMKDIVVIQKHLKEQKFGLIDMQMMIKFRTNFGQSALKINFCLFCGYSYQPERLNPEGKTEYGAKATAAWQDWMLPCDSPSSENK